MLLVADVHGAFDALAKIARRGETLMVLGDLLNFIDYRTNEGIIAEIAGTDFVEAIVQHRAAGDYEASRRLWRERFGADRVEIRTAVAEKVHDQYRQVAAALAGSRAYVTYGNVDWPELLRSELPAEVEFLDGESVEIDGVLVGMVGGGSPTPLGVPGEISEEAMAVKLERMGPVDVLLTHMPPDVPALRRDVITGNLEGGSSALLEYVRQVRPRRHFFGDIHQPQAARWRIGPTVCENVGYFRATKRAVRYTP